MGTGGSSSPRMGTNVERLSRTPVSPPRLHPTRSPYTPGAPLCAGGEEIKATQLICFLPSWAFLARCVVIHSLGDDDSEGQGSVWCACGGPAPRLLLAHAVPFVWNILFLIQKTSFILQDWVRMPPSVPFCRSLNQHSPPVSTPAGQ